MSACWCGSFLLACEDFDHSFPACVFYLFFFLLKKSGNLLAHINPPPLFSVQDQFTGAQRAEATGRVLHDELHLSLFQ